MGKQTRFCIWDQFHSRPHIFLVLIASPLQRLGATNLSYQLSNLQVVHSSWSALAIMVVYNSCGAPCRTCNCRYILSDHGSFVLIHVYVPNAGKKGGEVSERGDLKIRFLRALKAKCDSLQEAGRKVGSAIKSRPHSWLSQFVKFFC